VINLLLPHKERQKERLTTCCWPTALNESYAPGARCAVVPRRARIRGSYTLVSLSLRLKDLLGTVTRVKNRLTTCCCPTALNESYAPGAGALPALPTCFSVDGQIPVVNLTPTWPRAALKSKLATCHESYAPGALPALPTCTPKIRYLIRRNPLCPCAIAYRRAGGLCTYGLFKKPLCSPVCGHPVPGAGALPALPTW